MFHALLRLTLSAIVTAILFAMVTLALGHFSIDVMKWHAPMPQDGELAVLETGLLSTTPMVFGLSGQSSLLASGNRMICADGRPFCIYGN